ncbi:MAG: T9SS type A sorting domain-containing protein [Microscillaceae bacterium]|nr:T9SS type A sorting domain-containing protein [Microscillaceae bacterium]
MPSSPVIELTLFPGTANESSFTLAQNQVTTLRICEGTPILLEAFSTSSDGSPLVYEWVNIFSGATLSTGPSFSGTLPEGQYGVRVSDGSGTLTPVTVLELCVLIAPPINVSIQNNGSTTLCLTSGNPSLTLTALAENPNESLFCPTSVFLYQWYKNGSEIAGETQQNLLIPNELISAGIYSVVVANACGNANPVSITIDVVASPPLDVEIEGENFICSGQSVVLEGEAEGQVDSFHWFRVGNPNSQGNSNTLSVNTPGQYFLRATNGCGSTESDLFTVANLAPPTSITILSLPFEGIACSDAGVLMILDDLGASEGLERVQWFRDGALVADYVAPFPEGTLYQAFESGQYTARIENACGAATAPGRDILVIQIPTYVEVVASPFPTLAPNCVPPLAEITLTADTDGSELSYEWYFSASGGMYALISNEASPMIDQPGFYRVRVKNDCIADWLESLPFEITEITDGPIGTPNLSFSGDNPTCTGQILLATEMLPTGTRYEWYQNGNLLQTTTNPTLAATQSGSYTVRVVNACGVSDFSNAQTLEINLSPNNVVINPEGPVLVCLETGSEELILNATAEGSDLQYEWFRDGLLLASGTSTLTINASGTYALRAFNACGESLSEDLLVSFVQPPQPDNIVLTANICTNPIVLNVSTNATQAIFEWYRRAGANEIFLGSNITPSWEVNQSGTYFVKVRNACVTEGVASADVEVVVGNSLPTPQVVSSPAAGIDRICPGQDVTLAVSLSNPNGIAYRWFKDNSLMAGETGATLTVNQSGAYRVEIFASLNATCSRLSLPYFVFVRPDPTLLLTHQGPLAFCEGDSVVLRANALTVPVRYDWYDENGFLQSGSSLTVKTAGQYRLEAIYNPSIAAYPCDAITTQSVSVSTSPSPSPQIQREGGWFTVLDFGNSYQWNRNGVPILEANAPNYLPLDSGYYSVTIFNEIGCSGTSEALFHPGTYVESTPAIQISPNPNEGIFQIILTGRGQGQFRIYNQKGQLVLSDRIPTRQNSIAQLGVVNVRGLLPGLYLLRAEINGEIFSKKIIVY